MATNTTDFIIMQSGIVHLGKLMLGDRITDVCRKSTTHVFLVGRNIVPGQVKVRLGAKMVIQGGLNGYHIDSLEHVFWLNPAGKPILRAVWEAKALVRLTYHAEAAFDSKQHSQMLQITEDLWTKFSPQSRVKTVIEDRAKARPFPQQFKEDCYEALERYAKTPTEEALDALPSRSLFRLVANKDPLFAKLALPKSFPDAA